MFGSRKLAKSIIGLVAGCAAAVALSGNALAVEIPVTAAPQLAVPPHGDYGTVIQSADMGLAGVSTITTVTITDISGGLGGQPGMFSGYDIDAIILDRDGNINTTGDQFTPVAIAFTQGAIRPTANPSQIPHADQGPLFGLDNGGAIDPAASTLTSFDGVNIAHRDNADGFLSMGDGGILVLTFAGISVDGGLFLLFGEVGGQGEQVRVDVGAVPLPAAAWLFLSAIAMLLGMSRRRTVANA
jgi:hypothetical protein